MVSKVIHSSRILRATGAVACCIVAISVSGCALSASPAPTATPRAVPAATGGTTPGATAGVTATAASPGTTPVATASTTPVSPALAAYGSQADPLLKASVTSGGILVHRMQHDSLSILGNECSGSAVDLSNQQGAFQDIHGPSGADAVYKLAKTGYKYVLGATDECGVAADSTSKKQLSTSISDLKKGLAMLSHAEALTAQWASA